MIFFLKIYPVAFVNGSPIWYRTWDQYSRSMRHSLIIELKNVQQSFTPSTDFDMVVQKESLRALIEDRILTQSARALFPQFNFMSEERIASVISAFVDVKNAAQSLYGLNKNDFYTLILLPQAHREVAEIELDKKNINFAVWLAGVKKKTNVTVLSSRFFWNGEEIKEK